MVDDKRNYLYECYAKFLGKYRPRRFVFENVMGLLSAKNSDGRGYFDTMQRLFRKIGYEMEHSTLWAKNYGVLQNRKRVVLVGWREDTGAAYPEPEQWIPDVTVSEIFLDLPPLEAGEGTVWPCQRLPRESRWQEDAGIRSTAPVTWHIARPHTDQDREIYRIAVRQWNESKSRLRYGSLPPRLRTHRNGAKGRCISKTGRSRLGKRPGSRHFQTTIFFEGAGDRLARTEAFRQIGNAVPVLLSRRIAAKMKRDWDA